MKYYQYIKNHLKKYNFQNKLFFFYFRKIMQIILGLKKINENYYEILILLKNGIINNMKESLMHNCFKCYYYWYRES